MSEDGGPAFPSFVLRTPENPEGLAHGMSLRDYFAGIALSTMREQAWRDTPTIASEDAYFCADAMLQCRKGATK